MRRTGSTKRPSGRPRIALTAEETLELSRLHRRGKSLAVIARTLTAKFGRAISPSTVGRILRVARADAADFHTMLKTLRLDAFDAWRTAMSEAAKNGRSAPAEALLTATGDVEQKKSPGPGVVIVVGDGTHTIGALPQLPTEFRDAIEAETVRPDATSPVLSFDQPGMVNHTLVKKP